MRSPSMPPPWRPPTLVAPCRWLANPLPRKDITMNQILSRRRLLAATAIVPAAVVLAACPGPVAVPAFVAALQSVGQDVLLAMPQLLKAGLSGATAATVNTAINAISQVGNDVSAASTATQGQSALIQIEGYVNAIAPDVLPFLPLIPGGSIIAIVIAALPAIEAMLNFAASLLSAEAKAVAATAQVPAPAASTLRRMGATVDPSQAALEELLR